MAYTLWIFLISRPQRIYKSINGDELPLTEAEFKDTLDPVCFIKTRQGKGGPQESEVWRMIENRRESLAEDQKTAELRNGQLEDAKNRCHAEFAKLL